MMDTSLTPEQTAARIGKATASRMADVTAKTKTGWGASRQNYRAELIAERLTGAPAKRFVSSEMLWGIEQEQPAKDAYSWRCDADVLPSAFADHPTLAMTGASPDGLVGERGLVEIKCPNTATHLDTLLGEPIDRKYILQMQWQMECTGRDWCDFVSFDPRLPPSMQLFVKRIERDDELLKDLRRDVRVFLGEIDTIVAELRAKYEQAEAA